MDAYFYFMSILPMCSVFKILNRVSSYQGKTTFMTILFWRCQNLLDSFQKTISSSTLTILVEVSLLTVMKAKSCSNARNLDSSKLLEITDMTQELPFSPICKTCILLRVWWNFPKISMDIMLVSYSQQYDKILCQISVFLPVLKAVVWC